MPGKTSYLRPFVRLIAFTAAMVVLPLGDIPPRSETAYLVASEDLMSAHFSIPFSETDLNLPERPLPQDSLASDVMHVEEMTESAMVQVQAAVGGAEATQHVVLPGESLSDIAQRYRMTVATLVTLNSITNPHLIRPGQTLLLTPLKQTYNVRNGDTLSGIAVRFGVTVSSLVAENSIKNPNSLRVGQVLTIPESKLTTVSTRIVSSTALIWPVSGRISSYFGPRGNALHTGLDVAAPTGTNIYAARSGRVEVAGWIGGYGLTVILNHGDGMKTLYAHASQLLVKSGDRVVQGQRIARVGSTGNSTGPHVHFEVRQGGSFKDPLQYLPRR